MAAVSKPVRQGHLHVPRGTVADPGTVSYPVSDDGDEDPGLLDHHPDRSRGDADLGSGRGPLPAVLASPADGAGGVAEAPAALTTMEEAKAVRLGDRKITPPDGCFVYFSP